MARSIMSPLFQLFVAFCSLQGVLSATNMKKCNNDDCLRAFQHSSLQAASFCKTYTAGTTTSTPAFATRCPTSATPLATRLLSACSCFAGTYSTTFTSSSSIATSTSKTSTFTSSSSSSSSSSPSSSSSSSSSTSSSSSSSSTSSATPTPTPVASDNLIADPGFEGDDSVWSRSTSSFFATANVDTSVYYKGSASMNLDPEGQSMEIFQNVNFSPVNGKTTYMTFAMKTSVYLGQGCDLDVHTNLIHLFQLSNLLTTDWTIYTTSFTATSADYLVEIKFSCPSLPAVMWIDEIYMGLTPPS